MAMVASGALAGVELPLAQERQYVLGKTPLQAGMFMLPIMVAAGIGGPLAGWLSNRFGLRAVASASLLSAAITLSACHCVIFRKVAGLSPPCLPVLG